MIAAATRSRTALKHTPAKLAAESHKVAAKFGFLCVALLIGLDIVLYLLILLKEQPEHSIKFLIGLDLHFGVRAHRAEFLLKIDDSLNVVLLKRGLVRHNVVIGTCKVLL